MGSRHRLQAWPIRACKHAVNRGVNTPESGVPRGTVQILHNLYRLAASLAFAAARPSVRVCHSSPGHSPTYSNFNAIIGMFTNLLTMMRVFRWIDFFLGSVRESIKTAFSFMMIFFNFSRRNSFFSHYLLTLFYLTRHIFLVWQS